MFDYVQIKKDQIRRRQRRRTAIIIASIVIPILIVGFFASMHLNFMKTKAIEVNGAKLIDVVKIQELVRKTTTPGFFSKILFGDENFLFAMIHKKDVEADLTNDFPIAKSVVVSFDTPGRKIKVNIDEREQYGLWCIGEEKNNCFWFDREGVMFMKAPTTKGRLIKKVIDISGKELNIRDTVMRPYYVKTLEEIFDFLDSMDIRINTLLLKNRDLGEIETDNTNYPKIYFSLRYDPSFAVPGIQELHNKMNKLEYIDLRVNNKVFYK